MENGLGVDRLHMDWDFDWDGALDLDMELDMDLDWWLFVKL
jgi:hypothetical protein